MAENLAKFSCLRILLVVAIAQGLIRNHVYLIINRQIAESDGLPLINFYAEQASFFHTDMSLKHALPVYGTYYGVRSMMIR
jgi:hypothetical protein